MTTQQQQLSPQDYENQIKRDIAQFYDDPYGYVMYAFPWQQPNTPLEHEKGPDKWQREQLQRVGANIQLDPYTTIREITASGHGIGKSAEVAWVTLWAMSTRPHLTGWVTANTQRQLTSKTWRELSKWHKLAINKSWFEWTATRFYQTNNPETWGIDAVPWTEHNSEAFAGTHDRHVLMIMDEGSGIADIIWEVAEGAMTTPRAMWFAYGNPTRNTGRFHDIFGLHAHRWHTNNIDSRTAKMTNKTQIEEWKQDHGEDSDFFRVRVRGEFPHTASGQLIGSQVAQQARDRDLQEIEYVYLPAHIGVDVARFGDDETVVSTRQGRKHTQMIVRRGLDNMQVGALVAATFRLLRDKGTPMGAIFVDGVGLGAGVVDYLATLSYPVIDVNVGKQAEDKELYQNKRMEIWDRLRKWLEAGADIFPDNDLQKQLTDITYDFVPNTDKMRLESKDKLKERGLASPDRAESLALTFAERFVPHGAHTTTSFEPEIV